MTVGQAISWVNLIDLSVFDSRLKEHLFCHCRRARIDSVSARLEFGDDLFTTIYGAIKQLI
jgi:hypothetical protein